MKMLFCSFLIAILFVGCTPGAGPAPASPAVPAPTLAPRVDAAGTWEKVVADAKKEGKVVLYSIQPSEVRGAMTKALKERFGIELESVVGRPDEVLEKIMRERRSGLYLADAIMPGSTPIGTTLKPQGVLDKLEPVLLLPEVLNAGAWVQGKVPWWDRDHTVVAFGAYPQSVLSVNKEMVREGEITSYLDLLNPRWKGKMLIDNPLTAGVGQGFALNTGWHVMNVDYLRELGRQEPILMTDSRLAAEWLARGRYPIYIAPKTGNIAEFLKAGAPIEGITPKEGVAIVIGAAQVAVPTNAPHPNAAKVFVNWLLSKEGLTVYSKEALIETARIDIPSDFLPAFNKRQPGAKYIYVTYESEDEFPNRDERIKVVNEIFRPLAGK